MNDILRFITMEDYNMKVLTKNILIIMLEKDNA